jgi:ATP-binding cassette, subfamily C (CFTR/MRP), member 1
MLIPFFFVVALTFGASLLAVPSGKSQAAWIKKSEERVSATSKTLGSVKWLKISGLNDIAFQALQKLRVHELQVSRSYRLLLGASLVLRELPPFPFHKLLATLQ